MLLLVMMGVVAEGGGEAAGEEDHADGGFGLDDVGDDAGCYCELLAMAMGCGE